MKHTPEYFGTEDAGQKSARNEDERLSRCYELAGYALLLGTAPKNAILVHGTVHGFNAPTRIGHAWLELSNGEEIWEPIKGQFWAPIIWDALARPETVKRYTHDELRDMVFESQHWGTWH